MPDSKTLFVLLHGLNGNLERLEGVRQTIAAACTEKGITPVFCIPTLRLHLLSRADPCEEADIIVGIISTAAEAEKPDRIVLLGYSTGALLARKVYVIACGETTKAPFEPVIQQREPAFWAQRVERLVLLAGMNRGWRISHELGLGRAILWTFGIVVATILRPFGRRPFLIRQVHAGSEFITNLRIHWLRMRRRHFQDEAKVGGARVVQLLGTIDDFVAPTDTIDPITGSDFIYLDVPYSGHTDIVDMAASRTAEGRRQMVSDARRSCLRLAVFGNPDELKRAQVVPYDPNSQAVTCPEIRTVVFVIHGIRDGGFWTHKIARHIQKRSSAPETVATETSTYGYFPMLSFLLSAKRREKAEWLMDQYTEALACYPNATAIHFVGHSNGTYCLADALRRYPCCHFDNVVFAGSVVRTTYPWREVLRPYGPQDPKRRQGTVGRVLNIVATGDWVVAGFPNLFERWFPIQRLGGAGHFGFRDTGANMYELDYAKGGHSAGIEEPLWDDLANFTLDGTPPPPTYRDNRRSLPVTLLGLVPPVAWAALLGILVLAGFGVHWIGSALAAATGAQWLTAVALLLYGLLVWKLLRWV